LTATAFRSRIHCIPETRLTPKPFWLRCARGLALFLLYLLAAALTLWASAALYIDLRAPSIRHLAGVSYAPLIIFLLTRVSGHLRRFLVCAAGFAIVLVWWLQLKPSNDRPWEPDLSETPWAEIDNDKVTLHNFRSCDYRGEFDYTCQWLTKSLDLSELRGLDLAITYWGSPYIAHTILSFQFGDHDYVAASIETRKEIGKGYSAVLGFFRQYELVYVFADERDLIRLRTNFRSGEEVYLFHTAAQPEWARQLFLQYLNHANQLHDRPQWYNALTRNCTTVIFHFMADMGRLPPGTSLHNWRIILNGRSDEMLYKGGNFEGNLPFPELKESAHINAAARLADRDADFSHAIRAGRPGFEFLTEGPGVQLQNEILFFMKPTFLRHIQQKQLESCSWIQLQN
jgi:Domain of unknown function (DUF4105)